jgi:hypothetical protein
MIRETSPPPQFKQLFTATAVNCLCTKFVKNWNSSFYMVAKWLRAGYSHLARNRPQNRKTMRYVGLFPTKPGRGVDRAGDCE